MRLPALLSSDDENLPGIRGTARVGRDTAKVIRRSGEGDIAVIDARDLDRTTAEEFVARGVAVVVNAASSISGRFPNQGPEVLVANGIVLIDAVGEDVFGKLRDGQRVRIDEGKVFIGERRVAKGEEQSETEVADRMIEARTGLVDHLEAFSGNALEFMRSESGLLIDGAGMPEVRVEMQDRPVLVVGESADASGELRELRAFIKEYRPVLIGVGRGAETLAAAGLQPAMIVGDPEGIDDAVLRGGAELVLPAEPDGHAPGLERIQDLGIGAITFPGEATPFDMALLLAAHGDARLVVAVGESLTLEDFLDPHRREQNPSNLLARLRVGPRLVDGRAVASLYQSRVPGLLWALVSLAVLVVLIAVLLVLGRDTPFVQALIDTWNSFARWVRGLFS